MSDMPMVSITIIDMSQQNSKIYPNTKIPRGLSLKNNEMLLENFPQISSNYLF
jgi:hypothetical protein